MSVCLSLSLSLSCARAGPGQRATAPSRARASRCGSCSRGRPGLTTPSCLAVLSRGLRPWVRGRRASDDFAGWRLGAAASRAGGRAARATRAQRIEAYAHAYMHTCKRARARARARTHAAHTRILAYSHRWDTRANARRPVCIARAAPAPCSPQDGDARGHGGGGRAAAAAAEDGGLGGRGVGGMWMAWRDGWTADRLAE